jgi:hypothetical protein
MAPASTAAQFIAAWCLRPVLADVPHELLKLRNFHYGAAPEGGGRIIRETGLRQHMPESSRVRHWCKRGQTRSANRARWWIDNNYGGWRSCRPHASSPQFAARPSDGDIYFAHGRHQTLAVDAHYGAHVNPVILRR